MFVECEGFEVEATAEEVAYHAWLAMLECDEIDRIARLLDWLEE